MPGAYNGHNEGIGSHRQGLLGGPDVGLPMVGAPMGQILMPAPGYLINAK